MAGTIPPPSCALADQIAEELAVCLGPHTARVAVRTFAQKALGRGAETLRRSDLPALAVALRPMLRTLVGSAECEAVLASIERNLGK